MVPRRLASDGCLLCTSHAARLTPVPAASSCHTTIATLDPRAAPADAADDGRPSPSRRLDLFASACALPRLSRHDTALLAAPPSLHRLVAGVACCPALPPIASTMSLRRRSNIPATPRVTSPSPTPSEHSAPGYCGPTTRSASAKHVATPDTLTESAQDAHSSVLAAARPSRCRSRSPMNGHKPSRLTPNPSAKAAASSPSAQAGLDGRLAPPASTGWSWRDLSRSPSPLGLIPIHRHWRTFVHKHEVPRKALHVSIGFFVVWLYTTGTQATSVTPCLMAALLPIATTDWLRHRYAPINRLYVRLLGALMRETEYSGWNGVIFYLAGAWAVLYFLPKDVGTVSILLLSWCDTAASTFGRLWGRYTPRLRRGKSLAGSLAAAIVGIMTCSFFYGWLVPTYGPQPGDQDFMFKGSLSLPTCIAQAVGIFGSLTGPMALGVLSLWSGFVASASEVVDFFGLDDNLTIPVLSGIGIWGFLKLFT
ncbi:hypothetical protein CDD81_2674 [Ophiocordyceps australis]|uniref:Phosphatidate cytidylyltransferase n=1 Tax=Ophiocordyceps australis TaxID=1399860 RepID=A0A2C5XXI4_9HYPO|nr:hypothetical protein CDD81_2674 [Ophiocordyceps australis]